MTGVQTCALPICFPVTIGGVHEGAEIIKIITDYLPAGKAAKVLKTIKESWNNIGDYSKSVTTQTTE